MITSIQRTTLQRETVCRVWTGVLKPYQSPVIPQWSTLKTKNKNILNLGKRLGPTTPLPFPLATPAAKGGVAVGFQRGLTAPGVWRESWGGCLRGQGGWTRVGMLMKPNAHRLFPLQKAEAAGSRGSGYVRGTREERSVTATDTQPGELCVASALRGSGPRARELLHTLSSTNPPGKATSTPPGWSQQPCTGAQQGECSRKLCGGCFACSSLPGPVPRTLAGSAPTTSDTAARGSKVTPKRDRLRTFVRRNYSIL